MKSHIKKDEEVIVLTGRNKNQRGKVLWVNHDKDRVLVEGINMCKRHQKKTQDNPQGGIIEREASIHVSNVMSSKKFDTKRAAKAKKK